MGSSKSGDVYVDEPWLWIGWDRLHKCVHAEFKSFANSSEFRAGTTQILDLIRARKATALISDNRRLEGVTDLDQLWLRDSWLPMAVAAGVKRIAVVVASRGLGRVATEAVIGKFGKTAFETRMFESPSDAVNGYPSRSHNLTGHRVFPTLRPKDGLEPAWAFLDQ